MTAPSRWRHRPEGSNWGEYGPDDQIGRLNLLTPEKVRQGIAEVRDGERFCLSLPLDYPGGNLLNQNRHPPQLMASATPEGEARYLLPLAEATGEAALTDVVCDDRVLLHTQYSTQWDALSHVGARFDADGDGVAEVVFYNGWRGGEHISAPSDCGSCGGYEGVEAQRLGIETMAETAIQGRAVLVDLFDVYGTDCADVDFAGLSAAMTAQGAEIEPGDMLVLHTGFAREVLAMNRAPTADVLHGRCAALDGRDPALQNWIRECGVSAIIADNYAVERVPNRGGDGPRALLPLHELCLFKLGIPLGELWWLSELTAYLRARSRTRFLLTAPPLRLPGAVGSPVTPVATV
ncbi:MAG: cyclase family protein [Pseudomonadota bacterium]